MILTRNRFTALFPGPPRCAGARREPLDFMVPGKINRGKHTVRLGATLSGLTSAHLSTSTPIFTCRMPWALNDTNIWNNVSVENSYLLSSWSSQQTSFIHSLIGVHPMSVAVLTTSHQYTLRYLGQTDLFNPKFSVLRSFFVVFESMQPWSRWPTTTPFSF